MRHKRAINQIKFRALMIRILNAKGIASLPFFLEARLSFPHSRSCVESWAEVFSAGWGGFRHCPVIGPEEEVPLTSSKGSSDDYLKKRSGNNFKTREQMRVCMDSFHFHPRGVVKWYKKKERERGCIFTADTFLKSWVCKCALTIHYLGSFNNIRILEVC